MLGDVAANKTNTNPHPHSISVLGERGGRKRALISELADVSAPVVGASAKGL